MHHRPGKFYLVSGIATLLLATVCWQHFAASPLNAQVQQTPAVSKAYEVSSAFREVSRKALPAVVSIRTTGKLVKQKITRRSPFGNDPLFRQFFDDPRFRDFFDEQGQEMEREYRMPGGQGSGFIIDPSGLVMTNNHVVEGAEEVIVALSDGREFTATDIRTDARSDVAVVRIDVQEKLPYLPLGDDETMEIGDWVLAFGSPFGLHGSVTQGIISAKGRGMNSSRMPQEFIQTDAAINPGNSGGPLVNLRGEVVGINTAISTRSGGYDGVSLAVPVSLARWVADQLNESGKVRRAYLGIQMQQIDAGLAEAFNLKVPHGVVVTGVVKGAPADQAGFKEGDVILEVNGRQISNDRNMLGVVERLNIGDEYTVRILRDGKEMDLKIAVAERPTSFDKDDEPESESPESPSEKSEAEIQELGISVQELTKEIADQIGMPAGSGVVITSVDPNSAAAEAGLETAMVIARVGNRNVSSVKDVTEAVQAAKASGRVLLLVKFSAGNSNISRFVTVELKTDN